MVALGPPPLAPGSLTAPAPPVEVLHFLDALGHWRDDLQAALRSLDRRAQASAIAGSYTADLELALSLWESIDRRTTDLVTAWDSGRVGRTELAHLAELMWGRLPDALGNPSAFTLGEATTLAAALERASSPASTPTRSPGRVPQRASSRCGRRSRGANGSPPPSAAAAARPTWRAASSRRC